MKTSADFLAYRKNLLRNIFTTITIADKYFYAREMPSTYRITNHFTRQKILMY